MTGFVGHYRVLSFRFDVRSELPSIGRELERFLEGFRTAADLDGGPRYEISWGPTGPSVRVGGVQVYETTTERDVVSWVLADVHACAIDRERTALVIHAGAVSWRGRGIMLPAAPDAGKTTTVAGLVRAGFDYLTDEATIVDPDTLRLAPYPFPLKMERPSIDAVFGSVPEGMRERVGAYTRVHPFEIRPDSIADPCPLAFLIVPAYTPGGPTAIERITRAEALVATATQAVNLKRSGAQGFRVLERLLADAGCFRLRIGDLDGAVEQITRVADASLAGVAAALDGSDAEGHLDTRHG